MDLTHIPLILQFKEAGKILLLYINLFLNITMMCDLTS